MRKLAAIWNKGEKNSGACLDNKSIFCSVWRKGEMEKWAKKTSRDLGTHSRERFVWVVFGIDEVG